MNLRTIGKIGFLLVIIGFFMPVACEMNGFELANTFFENEQVFVGILMYLVFISAIAGIAIGVLLLIKKTIKSSVDWIIIGVCIVSGLIVYFTQLEELELNNGAYVILSGWIIALVGQIVSVIKKESV